MALKLISTFTAAGIGIAKQALSGDAKITFTRAAASVADWSQKTADELRGATKLDDEAQAVDISGIKTVTGDDGKASNDLIELEVTFPQAKIKEDYALRTVGLFAAPVVDGKQGAEVLYNVTTFDQPEWILQDSKGSEVKLKISTIVGDIEALTVVLPNGDTGGLTQDELDLFHTQLTKEYDAKYQPTGSYATNDAIADMETKTDASNTYQPKGNYAQAGNTVTTDGNQTISGFKSFIGGIKVTNGFELYPDGSGESYIDFHHAEDPDNCNDYSARIINSQPNSNADGTGHLDLMAGQIDLMSVSGIATVNNDPIVTKSQLNDLINSAVAVALKAKGL